MGALQRPGEVALMRVPVGRLAERAAYGFFTGRSADNFGAVAVQFETAQ